MAVIKYSRGRDKFDTPPEQRTAESEDAFIEQILGDIASSKYQQYFCAPMRKGKHPKAPENEKFQGEEGWRLSALADNWRVARFDCDSFDSPKTFQALMRYLIKFKGFCYTTFNHTAEAPRCRFVILLDKEVDRTDGVRVCQSIAAEIDAALAEMGAIVGDWQPTVGWDESVYNAECQCYTPIAGAIRKLTKSGALVTDAQVFRFDGQLADVDHYLAQCPAQITRSREQNTQCSEGGDFSELEKWCDVDGHTLADLRSALFSPRMLEISAGPRKPWQQVIAALGSLKNSPHEDEAWALALEWSEAGGAAFCHEHFEETWQTSRADMTSYKAIFSTAAEGGDWINPATIRPYLELEKTGFYMTEKGLMLNIEVGASKARMIVARHVCAPFSILGLTRDPFSDNWGKLIAFKNKDGIARHFIVPDEQLHKQGSDIPQRLAASGLWINTNMGKPLLGYLNVTTAQQRITCTPTTGWFGEHVFVLPDKTIGDSSDWVIYQHTGRDKCQLTQSATLGDWQQHVASKCKGNSRLIFSVSVALAAPLLGVTGMDGGVFSLQGASTKGKSTAQHVAASVWGSGATTGGYARNWNTSLVGLEVMAAAHNDLPLILDELKSASPKFVGHAAYMLAMGQGKGRGTKEITLRETLQWRTMVLASSEYAFESYLKASGEHVAAGQQARFVDVPAVVSEDTGIFENLLGSELTKPNAKCFADGLNNAAVVYYGCAGIHWLEQLTKLKRSALLVRIGELLSSFKDVFRPAGAGAQLDRVLDRFALCAAAGELATELGVTGWQVGSAIDGVGVCFSDYVKARGTVEDMEGGNGVDQLRAYLSTYTSSRFKISSTDKPAIFDGYITSNSGLPLDAMGLTVEPVNERSEDVSRCYWLTSDALRDRALVDCNIESTIEALVAMGAIVKSVATKGDKPDKDGLTANPRMHDPVDGIRRRYYKIFADKLFE